MANDNIRASFSPGSNTTAQTFKSQSESLTAAYNRELDGAMDLQSDF